MNRKLERLEELLKPKEKRGISEAEDKENRAKLLDLVIKLQDKEQIERLKPPYERGTELEKRARRKLWEALTDEPKKKNE